MIWLVIEGVVVGPSHFGLETRKEIYLDGDGLELCRAVIELRL